MKAFMKNENGEIAIELGKKYKDTIHGVEGIAVCHSRYLTGCDRVCLEFMKDGDVMELWFDVTRLQNVKIPPKEKKPGGPQVVAPKRIPR